MCGRTLCLPTRAISKKPLEDPLLLLLLPQLSTERSVQRLHLLDGPSIMEEKQHT